MENQENKRSGEGLQLRRSFGMKESVTITVGQVIGVGLFVTGANVVGLMGNHIILVTIAALLITISPSLLYAEMGSAVPYSGGTYLYALLGLSKPMGFLAGWNYIIAIISVASSEAFAFTFYFKTMFSAFGIELPVSDVVLACLCILVFTVMNVRGVEMTGRMSNAFMFFFWGVAIIWFIMMIPNINLPHFVQKPSFMTEGPQSFIANVAMVWWCFAGFEACCSMSEEIKYPHINIPRAMALSPFIILAVNLFFQWYLVGIVPTGNLDKLAVATAPYAEAMMTAGILGIPLALLAAGIAFGGGLSTMNSCITTPPRTLFAMARDGMLPQVFTKIHPKYKTPYVSILFLGVIALLLTMTNSVQYVASLSLFADLFFYVIGIISAAGMRKKHPDIHRPYKAPAAGIGIPVSAVIYIIMMTQLGFSAIISGVVWAVFGMVLYFGYRKYKGVEADEETKLVVEILEEPTTEERRKMDQEYKLWRNIVIIAVILSIALYVFPYFVA